MPGASGNTGLAQVLSGKADGYTLATYIQDTLMTLPIGLVLQGGRSQNSGPAERVVRKHGTLQR